MNPIIQGLPRALSQEKSKVHKKIAALCCNEKLKKAAEKLDLTKELKKAVKDLLDQINDKSIDKLFAPKKGDPKIVKELKEAMANLAKEAVKGAKDAIEKSFPDFKLPVVFCPKLPCPNPGVCKIKDKLKKTIDLSTKLAKDPLKKALKEAIEGKLKKKLPGLVEKVLDGAFDLAPFKSQLILFADVDLEYDCANDCFTKANIRVFIGLRFEIGVKVNIKLPLNLEYEMTLALGTGLDATSSLGDGKTNGKLHVGDGDLDKKDKPGALTWTSKFGDNPIWGKNLKDTESDILEDLGWKKADREQTYELMKEKVIDSLNWVTMCK